MRFHFHDPFDPRDPKEPREHYEDCPALADDAEACTCAEADEIAYDEAMERRVDALRDQEGE